MSDSVPATLSRAAVNVNDRVSGDNRRVALHGGLVGVAQDDDGALRPVAGWYVAPAAVDIDDVLDRIVRDHDTTAPRELPDEGPAEVIALYHRVGSATLFGGQWRLLPVGERHSAASGVEGVGIETLIELADGRSIASAVVFATLTTHWVLCRVAKSDDPYRKGRLLDDPADVPVLGSSLAMLLDAALDSGGDVAHLETGRLDQLGAMAG
ncbi:hypothetical protein [Dactylosporangium salmoneum]|uniref:Uncharacterized protein n=1 Tax=Dactylosporangium salmoneum TaxID=53361 RepID=A0ABP5UN29_9ACTN